MEQQPHNSAADSAAQSGEPDTPGNRAAPANTTPSGTVATPASLAVPGPQQHPLNEARRPQRLYHKVNVAMKLANKRISDRRFTEIGYFLTDEKLAEFKQEVRVQIRRRLDETIDTWPVRTYHDYRPDVRVAIGKAMEARWDLFDCDEDEFVPSELLLAPFYDE